MIKLPGPKKPLLSCKIGGWPVSHDAYCILRAFSYRLEPGHDPIYRPGDYGIYDPKVDRAQLNEYEQFQEDKIIVSESLTEFFILSKCDKRWNLLVLDNLTDSLLKMFDTKDVPLWLTFATQIYVDIHHVLRTDVKRAMTEMRATGIRTLISLQKYRTSPGPRLVQETVGMV